MTDLSLALVPLTSADLPAIDKLDDRAFGPGRFSLTAYRLRESVAPDLSLSCAARVGTLLVGANRMTPVLCGETPALLLGPVTVDPPFRSRGIARAMIEWSLAAARRAGHTLVILVGDEPYYQRFGFKRTPQGRLTMPGPVDPARLLHLELQPQAFDGVAGSISRAG